MTGKGGFGLAFPVAQTYFCDMPPNDEISKYLPVLILLGLAVATAVGMLATSVILGKRGRRNPTKDSAYECGMEPVGEAHVRFGVKFYLVAMLFILFDIEVVFLYPWAVVFRDLLKNPNSMIFGSMMTFIGILFIGYLYALKKGAFDWAKRE